MIGIRREDKNEWERRVPLTPDQIAGLIEREALAVTVQPSPKRAFPEAAFEAAGAQVDESLAGCDFVLGIKEVPAKKLEAGKGYLYFSHTTKAQPYNMPMLRRLLELGCTLLDYELIADDQGRRLIFFGRHAGYAGMIDGLWALGRRLELEGHETPFAAVRPAHAYDGLEQARRHIAEVGRALSANGMPEGLPPLVTGFTGTGNVSLGAQEIYDLLPVRELHPDEQWRASGTAALERNVAHKVVIDLEQRFTRKGGGAVTLEELSAHPERFENGTLAYLPGLTLLVSGMFWVAALPRLLGLDDLKRMWAGELADLKVIADIACDVNGAVEATVKATTPDAPVFVYDVAAGRERDGFEGDGPVILAVDNLPAELPREASTDFGATLMPFVPALARCDWRAPLEDLALPPELARAVIVHRGELTPRFAYLKEHVG